MSQKIRHDQLRSVLIAPHVSEKTTMLSQDSGQIVFRVRSDSNKQQIKKAVAKPLINIKKFIPSKIEIAQHLRKYLLRINLLRFLILKIELKDLYIYN